jgi:tetratricopeptide (TPR) repeat protein
MRRKLVPIAALMAATACTKIEARDLIREGNHLYRNADYEGAIAQYDASLELEPDGVSVLWNRACAAESMVLRLKDINEGEELEVRNKFAGMALADLHTWHENLEIRTPDDDKAFAEHRLAILSADSRCDELVAHWMEKHQQNPNDEGLYTVIARTFEETCGRFDQSDEWYVKRTVDFPDSPKAWYALAVRRFEPLFPEMDSGLPFNPALEPALRTQMAQEAIEHLNRATKLDGQYRDPYVWRSMAYNQVMFARQYQDPPEAPEDKLEAILARKDSMLAWRETKAVCDIDSIPDCPLDMEAVEVFENPGGVAGREVAIRGRVKGETVTETNAEEHLWEFNYAVNLTRSDAPPPPEPNKGEEAAEVPMRTVKVRYRFHQPPAEEGEALIDVAPHIEEVVARWKESKKEFYAGMVSGSGDVFEVNEKPPAACCPMSPLSAAEEAADETHMAELHEQIRLVKEAEAKKQEKRKGRRR